MKKTVTANLNGRVFNVDEDAFQLLESYLKNLRHYFRNEEGYDEIVADFEARLEELLSDRVRLGYNVISIEEVEKVIAKVGSPVDFEDNEEKRTAQQPKVEPAEAKKKFYRDPSDKLLGGVCSGLATYFGVNELALRILVVILAIFTSGLPILLVYLVMWLVVPEATTAEQKLEMQGKPITVENIGKIVSDGVDYVKKKDEQHGCLGSLVDFIAAFTKVALVGLGCIIGIPILFVLGIIIIVLFATVFGVGTGIVGGLLPWTPDTFLLVAHPEIAIPALCLLLGIPLFALLYGIISWIFKLKPVNKNLKIAGLIVWILALIALPFSGFKADWTKVNHNNNHWSFGYSSSNWDELVGNGVLAERTESLPFIQSVKLTGNLVADLQIEQIPERQPNSLLINGDSNLIDQVEINTDEDGHLTLSTKNKQIFKSNTDVIIQLKTDKLNTIETKTVGNVTLLGAYRIDQLAINTKGAGTVNADSLYVNHLSVKNQGAAAVVLAGTAKKADFDLKGVGSINALNLVVDSVDAQVKGVGSIKCNPVLFLDGDVNGVGSISYKSEPKKKNTHVHGIGSIQLD